MNKKLIILIVGTGVLGSYLAKVFIENTNKVFVTTRKKKKEYKNYKSLNIQKKISFLKLNILNKKEIEKKIELIKPDIIYYFAGQSSVFKSFKSKKETFNSNFIGAKNFLTVLKKKKLKIKFFKANSAYIFEKKKTKLKFVKPKNPYVDCQIKSFKTIKKFKKLGVNCYNLIFYNIESPLKSKDFLLNKVKNFVKFRSSKFLRVGNVNGYRDFSWAPEIMLGVYYSLNLKSQDLFFGSGKLFKVKDMIKYFLKFKKIDFDKSIKIDPNLYLKDKRINFFNSSKKTISLLKKWNWNPKTYGFKLVKKLYYSK